MLAYIGAKFGVTGYVDPGEVRYNFCPNLPHRVDRLEEKFLCGNNRGETAECCIATRTSSHLMMIPQRRSYDRSR